MSAQERLSRLTGFLYGLAIVMFAGTILELIAARHFKEPMQLVPFVLCVAGIGAVFLAWQRPDRRVILGLRALMVVTAAGTALGIWKHIEGNMGFIQEMHPGTSGWALISGALTGRAPLLASGVLTASAVIAIAATFAAGWDLAAISSPERFGASRQSVSTMS
jgi:hypothetical protein